MDTLRKPFQGIFNIIRFNWHFYVLPLLIILFTFVINNYYNNDFNIIINFILSFSLLLIFISLIVSYYIYDLSDLYKFKWMEELPISENILNIHAGFDETSPILEQKFPNTALIIYDFYDAKIHTEISIKRARNIYPPSIKTIKITSKQLPAINNYFDLIFNILSAHEIRNNQERIQYFKEQNRTLKPEGRICVTEHLRDLPNFLAYTIGFFHFHSKNTWEETFREAGLEIEKKIKTTAFITTFILKKNGTSS